jgi:hypothetical protein
VAEGRQTLEAPAFKIDAALLVAAED